MFEWFLKEKILSRCNSFSKSRSILIMNNVSIHYHRDVWNLCAKHDIWIRYFSFYFSNFNSIENKTLNDVNRSKKTLYRIASRKFRNKSYDRDLASNRITKSWCIDNLYNVFTISCNRVFDACLTRTLLHNCENTNFMHNWKCVLYIHFDAYILCTHN